MKKTYIIFNILFLHVIAFSYSIAQTPAFNLRAMNFVYTDSIGLNGIDALKFDLYIQHTNPGVSGPFEYALGQYYFNINGALGVTSDFNYYIVPGSTTFCNVNAIPRNPTFISPDATSPTGASLKLNSNATLESGNGPIILSSSPGTRVCTMKFKKKSGVFPIVPLSLNWRLANPNPFTKIFANISNMISDISTQGIYSIDTTSSIVTLISPSNNSIYNPVSMTLIWKKFRNPFKYILNIYSDSLLSDLVYNYQNLTDTFKTVGVFNSNSRYYWRVGAKDTAGEIYYSQIFSFRTIPLKYLSVKLLFEGMYYPLFNQLSRKDTVKTYIRQSYLPYSIIDSAKSVIDSLSFRGLFKFLNVPTGTYYITVKHFNSIETWCKSGGTQMLITDTTFYDFTTSISQAYGNNLKLKSGKYCIYGGDVDQDGVIDASDLSLVDNDVINGVSGYVNTDVTGDNYVDAQDVSQIDNNSLNFVGVVIP